tara:strand:- start:1456 stop:1830 length:375 start_codon:yes stop_codon:yes gene_type:complete
MSYAQFDDSNDAGYNFNKEYEYYEGSYTPIGNDSIESWEYDNGREGVERREVAILNIDVKKGISREEAKLIMQLAEAANLVRVRSRQCEKLYAEVESLREMNEKLEGRVHALTAMVKPAINPTP